MLEQLRGDEKKLLDHLQQLRAAIVETEASLHRTQGALVVVGKLVEPEPEVEAVAA